MSYSFLDFLCLLGAVGLFLYGMKVMSEGLQKAAGDRLRGILSSMTRNRFTGTVTGFLITALIQSSSASTVMVVSFVNAGLMTLSQSMAVIMCERRHHRHGMGHRPVWLQGQHVSLCAAAHRTLYPAAVLVKEP